MVNLCVIGREGKHCSPTALDKEVTEAHALKKNTTGGLEQINKTYSTIRKRWKNLYNVRSEPTSDVYHYVGSQQVRQNDLYTCSCIRMK